MINARERFAKSLGELVKAREVTGKQLGEETGISRQAIYRYLKMESSPRIEEVALLCEALGVSASELLGF